MKKTIDFLTYEGLQIKYEKEELIIIPLEITQSKVGESGIAYLQTFWKHGRSVDEVPSYHVKWKHKADVIEVVYSNDEDDDGIPFNDAINKFAKKDKTTIYYGREQYFIKDGHVSKILWYADCSKGEITYNSEKDGDNLEFVENYEEKRQKRISKQVVRKSDFREAILRRDKKCVVSKIAIPEVLQAAHIVAVQDNGFEHVSNGIMLRSDLHLMFDSGILKIDNAGIVHINEKRVRNAKEYMQYDGVKIGNATLKRIRGKLKEVNSMKKIQRNKLKKDDAKNLNEG